MDESGLPKPKRRWYQFSLRTLFVLVTLFAVFCSWYTHEMRQAAKRRAAIAEIRKLNGVVVYYDARRPKAGGEPPKWYSWMRKLHGEKYLGNAVALFWPDDPTDADLVHLGGLAKLELLDLRDTQVTDAGLVHLKDLTNLRFLLLDDLQITNAGLVHLEDLTKLELLNLTDTQVTDAGLVHLEGLTNLESLGLAGTQVTDAGLVHVEGLKNLDALWLHDTQVTDAGAEHLKGLTSLKVLCVFDTKATDEGVRRLQEALPDCEIYHE